MLTLSTKNSCHSFLVKPSVLLSRLLFAPDWIPLEYFILWNLFHSSQISQPILKPPPSLAPRKCYHLLCWEDGGLPGSLFPIKLSLDYHSSFSPIPIWKGNILYFPKTSLHPIRSQNFTLSITHTHHTIIMLHTLSSSISLSSKFLPISMWWACSKSTHPTETFYTPYFSLTRLQFSFIFHDH